MCKGVYALGITLVPRCKPHFRRTCAGVMPRFWATEVTFRRLSRHVSYRTLGSGGAYSGGVQRAGDVCVGSDSRDRLSTERRESGYVDVVRGAVCQEVILRQVSSVGDLSG